MKINIDGVEFELEEGAEIVIGQDENGQKKITVRAAKAEQTGQVTVEQHHHYHPATPIPGVYPWVPTITWETNKTVPYNPPTITCETSAVATQALCMATVPGIN